MENEDLKPRKEIKEQSAKKNYIYNVVYQVILLFVPIIVTPYLSRVLTPDGIGQYSYASSLISYFALFSALGFGYYAQREIVKNKDNAYEQSCIFWEILLCRLIPSLICLSLNLLCVFLDLYGENSTLMLIMSTNIVAIALDITYYFQGMEDFKRIVLRNLIIKLLSVALIFIFVRTKEDLWLYALINYGVGIVGSVSLWFGMHNYLVKVKVKDLKPMRHMSGTLKLFIPTIIISIYTVLDKTLIGIITQSNAQNGFYEQADKLVKIALTVITCLGSVMIPRNSKEFKNGNIEKLKSNIYSATKFVWLLGTAFAFGLSAIIFNMNEWFFGIGYKEVNSIVVMLSALTVIIGLSNVIGIQYLLPVGKDKIFTITVTVGAVVNVILSIPMIKLWGAFGAAIATLIAEAAVTLIQIILVRKELKPSVFIFGGIKNIIAGGVMFAVVFFVSRYFTSSVLNTFLLIMIGAATYFICLLILVDKFFLDVCKKVFGKIFGSKNKS